MTLFSSSLLAALAAVAFGASAASAQACNGYASLCSKSYSQIAYATTHNSFAFQSNAGSNQHYNIPQQLTDGIRGLMFKALPPLTSDNNANGIELCHTSCQLLDGGTAQASLSAIKTWLDANPNEVVTIIWENPNSIPIQAFINAYSEAGLANYLYTQTPAQSQTWPTLQQMITAGTRLVSFSDQTTDPSAPWLMNTYDYMFETAYQNFNASSFTCTVDRPPAPDTHGNMYVLNNFIYGVVNIGSTAVEVPQPGQAADINSIAVLGAHATNCEQTFGSIPNFVTVDFYEQGQVFQVVDSLNGVAYVSKTLGGGQPTPTATSSSSNGITISFGNTANTPVNSFSSFLGVLIAYTLAVL